MATNHTHSQPAPTTHQALEPVAHYTRLNNYFNKQQSSSPSWTVLERRAHNTIFQISIKSKCWESCPRPHPMLYNPLSLSFAPFLSFSGRNPSTANCSAAFIRMEASVRWARGTLLIFYVSYLTFDFWKIYINILFYGIQLALPERSPERDSSARPDENVLQKIAPRCLPAHLEQCVGKSGKLAQVGPSRNAGAVDIWN